VPHSGYWVNNDVGWDDESVVDYTSYLVEYFADVQPGQEGFEEEYAEMSDRIALGFSPYDLMEEYMNSDLIEFDWEAYREYMGYE
jgi:hypothetical protein